MYRFIRIEYSNSEFSIYEYIAVSGEYSGDSYIEEYAMEVADSFEESEVDYKWKDIDPCGIPANEEVYDPFGD